LADKYLINSEKQKDFINNQNNNQNNNSILNSLNFNNFNFPKSNSKTKDEIVKPSSSVSNVVTKYVRSMHELSKKGFAGENVKKVNQDNYFVYKNFLNDPNSMYISVLDGHGTHGHDVSKYLKDNLPVNMHRELLSLKNRGKMNNANNTIEEVFLRTNNDLNTSGVDTFFSGSTCVSMIYTPEKLKMANIGDSRAVLGRCVNGSK